MKALSRQLARAAAAAACALLLACGAEARSLPEPVAAFEESSPLQVVQRGRGGISLQQAIALAQQRYNGRVLRAATVNRGGRQVHEILILDNGRARTVRVDAQSGQFM